MNQKLRTTLMIWSGAIALLTLLVPVQASDPAKPMLWSAADLKGMQKTLIPKMDETKGGNQQLMMEKSHNVLVFHREGSGPFEMHEKLADFMVVTNGEGTILIGSKLVDPKSIGTNEFRGRSMEGAKPFKIAKGDVLYVPANTPHRTIVEAGKQLDVMVIKVQP